MNKSESIGELAKALSFFQGEIKQPRKDKTNPFFKSTYVDLTGVVEAIAETAPKHGLSFLQYPVTNGEYVGIVTVLMHSSGEFIETDPVFAKPVKQDPQAVGSVITYLKRYSLSAVFGITSDEDDDGNKATHAANNSQTNNNAMTAKQKNDISRLADSISKKTGVAAAQVYNNASKTILGIEKQSKDLTSQEAEKIIKHLSTFE